MAHKNIKAAVVGAAGFAGIEAVRLLFNHPHFELVAATSNANAGEKVASVYPAFAGVTDLEFSTNEDFLNACVRAEEPADNGDALAETAGGTAAVAAHPASATDAANSTNSANPACDIAFLAVPHTAALPLAPQLLNAGVTVIDLSADFRLDDPAVYEKWYETKHTAPHLLKQRAFGLPELFAQDLQNLAQKHAAGEAVLVGCAGCYPTATSLAAAPACRAELADPNGVVVADAISGVTGAGKKATQRTHYCFANENLEAYGIANHRHTPEIAQILGLSAEGACSNDQLTSACKRPRLVFTPHLAPLNRGLLSTVNIPLDPQKPAPTQAEIDETYSQFYAESPLVTYMGEQSPRTASVAGTCRAQVSAKVNAAAHTLVCVGAIDNLGKGAAGQAVQCANIVCGLPETAGLELIACPV